MKSCGDYRVGTLVRIRDNQRIVTHITPRWAYGLIGEIVRVNNLSLTVRLVGGSGEQIRVDYVDALILHTERR